ncbi:hypothetical protein CO115_00950 [Candidatus Falkowbacteria bacterium CG_4_9_14_3_um_filter_36_9]|uniref:HD domain-containing protein n=2 Tax=Candidatus Falkowiibacteriota TaxID=1752728 RepID=A0A1J4T9N2_9BACT|nr:MAG: hypothetical protein AUJ27_00670 [Candidatus Falkowbacteria bacterium CG1_02_37_44]PIV50918.1 MAG: hypothetical protein COS18_03675 [Candidatus Falkowbacteria bacterium CG02_land_8_20_14_3_00_36_14]PIX11583.1 MAG: hypothetical protein COZ73_02245 [Candidatus Falkowbacteria bacterium CG_4_8_14_3_um_filter_36_11]PJA10634.1 MAG: hypothetical protein COX67_04025 [Candidatus Falkowbacteria bacterium CG_4_10_14_0_2_um_filter_36_22]PJB20614.1 MAG: hypothetical protein CO115_00950 [Candidatus F
MTYNYNKIRNKVRDLVKKACYANKNIYTHTVWPYHIIPVVGHSLFLAKKLGADKEAVELAAYLHDYSSLLDHNTAKDHHNHSSLLARKILTGLKYPEEKIKEVVYCIYTHRGSIKLKRETLEAKIVASADAMSHISDLADMFYLTFGVHKYQTRKGVAWLKKKINQSWQKIMPAGREIIKDDYKIAMQIIKKAEKRSKLNY